MLPGHINNQNFLSRLHDFSSFHPFNFIYLCPLSFSFHSCHIMSSLKTNVSEHFPAIPWPMKSALVAALLLGHQSFVGPSRARWAQRRSPRSPRSPCRAEGDAFNKQTLGTGLNGWTWLDAGNPKNRENSGDVHFFFEKSGGLSQSWKF